jgi:hypothetical protein
MATATVPQRPDVRTAADRLDALERGQERIERKIDRALALLEKRGGLSAADRRLLDAIRERVGAGSVFGATELYRDAESVEGELREAVLAAKLTDARSLGRRLQRIADRDRRLRRSGRDANGIVWEIRDDE